MPYRSSRKRRPKMDELTYEKDLQETIRQAAHLYGWKRYHTYDSRRSPEGFPDDVLVGYGKLLFWEYKTSDGRISPAQRSWFEALSNVESPPQVEIIRPADLDRCLELLACPT